MSEPLRLRDDASVPSDLRDLLSAGERSRTITREARARSTARVDRLVAVPAAAGLLLWLKGVAIAAGLSVVGVVTVTRVLPALDSAPAVVVPHAATGRGGVRGSVDILSPPRSTPTPTPTPTPTLTPTLTLTLTPILTPTPTSTAENDVLAHEVALLEKANASLDRDPASSLATLDAYAAAFPAGTLSMERELIAVDALQRLGRVADARDRGERLLGRARGSIYEERVTKMLATLGAR